MTRILFSAILALVIFPLNAWAACTSPTGTEGQIIYNTDYHTPQYCNDAQWTPFGSIDPAAGGGGCSSPSGVEAQMIYNTDYHVYQYCDGTNWMQVGNRSGGSLIGPSGCANIGDLCADGTVFAGYQPITQDQLFIPPTDQGTTSPWKTTSTGTDDIATDSTYDGRINSNQVANSATFPAFKLCKDLTTGGHGDWYLPSQVELYYLWAVSSTIQAAGHITNFQNTYYWSSTEYPTDIAWTQLFSNGAQIVDYKTTAYRVRCVRR